MKKWKKLITMMSMTALLILLSAVGVLAAEKESYTYSVTFYAGVQGSFHGTTGLSVDNEAAVVTQTADEICVSGLKAGDRISFNAQAGVMLAEDSKYYVQGMRLSGRDNDTVAASVFVVEEDADYVVAYGIRGNMTSYTVNYQTANGAQLAPSETFYGNVGDKPVIAYQYIEGYAPQAFGLTKTLSENATENVFTFVYGPVPTQNVQTIVQPSAPSGPSANPGTAAGGTADNTDGTTPGNTVGDTTNNAAGTADESMSDNATPGGTMAGNTDGEQETFEEGTIEDDTNAGVEEETPEIVDLDEEEVPLTDKASADSEAKKSFPIVACAVIAIAAVFGIAYAGILIKRRRR